MPEFRREDPTQQSQQVQEWVQSHRQEQGTWSLTADNKRYSLVTLGEKPTGGYSIKVARLLADAGQLIAITEIKAPAQGAMVTQALTYPLDLISLPVDAKELSFAYQGDLLALAAAPKAEQPAEPKPPTKEPDNKAGGPVAESSTFKVFAPEPGSVISSPVRVRGQARVFEATFTLELEDGHNILAEKVVTATDAGPAWGDFDVNLTFDKPTSPNGMLLFVTYSAKDGSRKEELQVPVRFTP